MLGNGCTLSFVFLGVTIPNGTMFALSFDESISLCPACKSENILQGAFRSVSGFMSLPNIVHDKCLDCMTVFVNPLPSRPSLTQFYTSIDTESQVSNEIIQSSVSRYFDSEKRLYFIENRVKPIMKYLPRGAKLIDVGCGSGVFVRFMIDEGYDAVGFDFSPISIEIGSKYLDLNERIQSFVLL